MPTKAENQDAATQPKDGAQPAVATPPPARIPPADKKRSDRPPPGQDDTEAAFLGFLLIAAILYFALVWGRLPSQPPPWLVTALLVLAVGVTWFAVRRWKWLSWRLAWLRRRLKRWGGVATDLFTFLVVVLLLVASSIWLDTADQIVLLKLFVVLYFSMLPALLYLQFSSGKTLTVWKEFVLNLYKLQADDPANLPRPPTLSRFHEPWRTARRKALGRELADNDPEAERLELANIYRVKFRDLFGPVPQAQQSVLSLKSVHKLQVVITTVLVTIGWIFVVQPETVYGASYIPSSFELERLPQIPRETFAFAFLGAYFYILQMLVRRYFQNDLKATAYINATMRIVVVILLVWTIDPLLQGTTTQAQRNAIAFVIGVFPTIGWQLLVQTVVRVAGVVVPALRPTYKLTDIDGLSVWYESRLLEVGVEDMQNLATTDVVDLMLNTRIPVDRLVDWIDQALLYLRVTDEAERETLRRYGIRSASDLLDVFADKQLAGEMELLLNKDGEKPSRLRSLVVGLQHERNLQRVQAWKSFRIDTREAPQTRAA